MKKKALELVAPKIGEEMIVIETIEFTTLETGKDVAFIGAMLPTGEVKKVTIFRSNINELANVRVDDVIVVHYEDRIEGETSYEAEDGGVYYHDKTGRYYLPYFEMSTEKAFERRARFGTK